MDKKKIPYMVTAIHEGKVYMCQVMAVTLDDALRLYRMVHLYEVDIIQGGRALDILGPDNGAIALMGIGTTVEMDNVVETFIQVMNKNLV